MYKIAQAYAMLNEKASALRVLRRIIEGNFCCYPHLINDPLLENLRHDDEFKKLVESARQRHGALKRAFF